jgi:membrane associated rhomboid family serine protease
MRSAAVGFHCPDCVSEGARTTRSARTAYGGNRSANPALTSQVLIGINAAIWLVIMATGQSASPWVDRLALLPVGGVFRFPDGSLHQLAGVADGAPWQLLTSMFTHVQIMHIGFNMLALWFLGPQLEAAVGRLRFLALYLLSGLTGSALVFWLAPIHTPTIGASGAIFGLMGGLLVIALKVRADVTQLLVWVGLNFVITVLGRGFISWQGHLGGFIGGLLIGAVIAYAPRPRRSLWQGLGLGLLSALLVVACIGRTLMLA